MSASRTTPPSPTSSSSPGRVGLRTGALARNRYVDKLQLSLSCISQAVWLTSPPDRDGCQNLVTSDEVLRLRLQEGRSALHLKATQLFHPVKIEDGGFKIRTDAYAYTLSRSSTLKPELFAWHWHPQTRPTPHLHIQRYDRDHGEHARLHVPTGRVLFEEIVRFLIRDLNVRFTRGDWEDVIDDVIGGVKKAWSWS